MGLVECHKVSHEIQPQDDADGASSFNIHTVNLYTSQHLLVIETITFGNGLRNEEIASASGHVLK